MNGTISATGSSANATVTIDLTMVTTTSNSTYTMAGTVTAAKTATSHTIGMTLTISGSTYSETVTGRFYYDQTGYVDLTTPTPLTGSYSTSSIGLPPSGELRMTYGGTTWTVI